MRNEIKQRLIALSMTMLLGMGAWGCGSDTAGGDTPTPDPTGTPVTITGTISTNASASISTPLRQGMKKLSASVSADTTPAPGMAVTVTKINSDGTTEAVTGATATTDADGNYSLVVDSVTSTAAGQADYYYKISATDGTGTTVLNSVAAPTADSSVPVSPGTTFAEAVLDNGVGGISGTPSPDQINNMNNLYDKFVTDRPPGEVDYPPNTNTPDAIDAVLAAANGASANGGDAQSIFQGVIFESNFYSIVTDITTDATDKAQYIKKAITSGCDQPSQQPLSDLDASVLGQALQAGITTTPTEIVAAMNAASNDPDVAVDTAVSSFVTLLTNIESVSPTTGLDTSDLIALNVKRNLTAATFSATTVLDADQAVAFIESLNSSSTPPPGPGPTSVPTAATACNGNLNITDILAELTGSTELDSPAISNVQIYADSGFGCSEPLQGHFRGEVQVYLPFNSTNSVTNVNITGTNGVNLDQSSGSNGLYTFNTDGVCVNHGGMEVTYTVSVTLANTAENPLPQTVNRNHPLVPETNTTVDGVATTGTSAPTTYSVPFPLFTWEDPVAMLASITDAPANSAVKYTYEFSYADTNIAWAPESPMSACPSTSAGPLYTVSSILPTTECDPEACAALANAAVPTPSPLHVASDIVCRLYIQTILVDESDNFLGKSAGDFTGYQYTAAP